MTAIDVSVPDNPFSTPGVHYCNRKFSTKSSWTGYSFGEGGVGRHQDQFHCDENRYCF